MPKRRAAVKRLRVDKKRHQRNVTLKRVIKKTLKNYRSLVTSKKTEDAQKTLPKVYSILDKAAKKNIMHYRTADRLKARLAQSLTKKA
ncbi:MAG: 30S ribosomal protein S20 [Candidatus Omnitrophica bacterium]|nr:30S ribosomal protein S20 [Candidatus Omnitrophota bacterium]